MTTARACPACGGRDAELVHHLKLRTPDGHPLGDGYRVVSCLACGTGFADVAARQDFYDRYYAQAAKYADAAATAEVAAPGTEVVWNHERLDRVADHIELLTSGRGRGSGSGGRSARLLDMGCANGALLGHLLRRGFTDVRGVDPSPRSAAVAAAQHGVRVEVGTFSSLPPGIGRFDCICLTGVLEHVWDVDAALDAVTSLLRPGGVVYVDVPDASRYLDPYIAPFEDFSTEHVNHFSGATLAVLAGRFRLAPVFQEQYETDLVPGKPCAVVTMAWRSSEVPAAPVKRDHLLAGGLHAFAARSGRDMAAIDRSLDEQLAGNERFAVWGTGEFTLKLLALSALARRRLVALVDGNPGRRGLQFGDIRVASPDTLTDPDVPIVIGSLLSEGSIRRAIDAAGLPNPVAGLAGERTPSHLPF